MNITNLVRIHEARIAHHVAAIGQVNRQNRAAAKLDIRSSMTMNVFVFSGTKVTTEEERLDARQKRRIGRHHIFKQPVLRTGLSHQYLTVVFNDLGLDLTGMLEHQHFERHLTSDHRIANFFDTGWTETVGLAWETEWWSSSFVGFEKRTGRPVWPNRLTFGQPLVDRLKRLPRHIREAGDEPGTLHSRQLAFFGLPSTKLVTKQRLRSPV